MEMHLFPVTLWQWVVVIGAGLYLAHWQKHRLSMAWMADWWNGFSSDVMSLGVTQASALVGCGTGTQIGFGTTSWTSNLLSVGWSGIKRKALDTAYMGTTIATTNTTAFGSMTFIPSSLTDAGSLKFKCQFNPDKVPLIDTAAEVITVTWPKGSATTGAKWSGSGFVTDFEVTSQLENIMEADVTVKMSGSITFANAIT